MRPIRPVTLSCSLFLQSSPRPVISLLWHEPSISAYLGGMLFIGPFIALLWHRSPTISLHLILFLRSNMSSCCPPGWSSPNHYTRLTYTPSWTDQPYLSCPGYTLKFSLTATTSPSCILSTRPYNASSHRCSPKCVSQVVPCCRLLSRWTKPRMIPCHPRYNLGVEVS